jgi:hypothetical protein
LPFRIVRLSTDEIVAHGNLIGEMPASSLGHYGLRRNGARAHGARAHLAYANDPVLQVRLRNPIDSMLDHVDAQRNPSGIPDLCGRCQYALGGLTGKKSVTPPVRPAQIPVIDEFTLSVDLYR